MSVAFLIYISFWKVLADRSRGSHLATLLKVLSLVILFLAFIFPPLKKTGNLIHSSWTFHKVRRFCQEVRIKRFQFWTKSSSQQHEEPWCKELFTKELFKGTALSNAAFANASYISISPDWFWTSSVFSFWKASRLFGCLQLILAIVFFATIIIMRANQPEKLLLIFIDKKSDDVSVRSPCHRQSDLEAGTMHPLNRNQTIDYPVV